MRELVNIITPLHKKTSRDYLARMVNDKVNCMLKAKEYEADYWDGDRKYGYGGYKYDGRWKPVAEQFIERYKLTNKSKVLDIGCGKAFILFEISKLLPGIQVVGIDVSNHGLGDAPEAVRPSLFKYKAQDPLPFGDDEFDLAFSITTFHNLKLFELKTALAEMDRVARQGYLCVESYRNEKELFNLQCWALTCESFFETSEWIWLYSHFGYTGDYEFIYME
jgi:SAM-dependent methyltransferase